MVVEKNHLSAETIILFSDQKPFYLPPTWKQKKKEDSRKLKNATP